MDSEMKDRLPDYDRSACAKKCGKWSSHKSGVCITCRRVDERLAKEKAIALKEHRKTQWFVGGPKE